MAAASAVGLVLSLGTLLLYTFGVFVGPLTREFGWTRTQAPGALAATLPPLAQFLLVRLGWREAFAVLGALTLAVTLPAALMATRGARGPTLRAAAPTKRVRCCSPPPAPPRCSPSPCRPTQRRAAGGRSEHKQ